MQKVSITSFGYLTGSLLCHSYRQYNQAFFEEIIINNPIEARVAQNYREKFIVTSQDIGIVFEMYCKEDYADQFIKTQKVGITHKQFVDLFVICLKNDSMKIAMLIYIMYMRVNEVVNASMLDLFIDQIRESSKQHEIKLMLIHNHFDLLSVQQLGHLLDAYLSQINSTNYHHHPIVNCFNTVKVSLLVYLICWKIEQQKIYSLITKCAVLKNYLEKSLDMFLEKQSNILVLEKVMQEPILHLEEKKTCLDIMNQMNMTMLL